VKVGYSLQINNGYIYYTTDGSNPEGAFGVGKGTTQVVPAHWVDYDNVQGNVDWWKATIPGQAGNTQVRYKVAFFRGGSPAFAQGITNDANQASIQPISYAEASGSKLFGLTQAAITNFNPANALVWLHNDLNPANTITGLQSGFHIVRARTFLPVSNYYTNQTTLTTTTPLNYVYASQAQVYNTFAQTFYYDGGLPGGVILNPPNDGYSISNFTYTFDLRADGTVSSVQFNIQTSFTNYWDIYTGAANGIGNDTKGNPIYVSATQVTPNPNLNLQYPNYPEEFQFNFADVPYTGTATISVRLNDYATSVYTNEFTMLTRTVNTVAPQQTVILSSPTTNNTIITLNSSNLVYLVQACFGTGLASAVSNFDLTINGVLVPQSAYIIRPVNYPGCPGMNSLLYQWNVTNVGTYLIQASYTNGLTLSDSKTVMVAPPFQITSLANAGASPVIVWGSTPGVNYQVLVTTNLAQPFQPVGPIVTTNGYSASLIDTSPAAPQKFYVIEIVP